MVLLYDYIVHLFIPNLLGGYMIYKKSTVAKTMEKSCKSAATPSPEKLTEEISKRAYEIHLQRGGAPGSDMDDWLKAEKEVKAGYCVC